MSSPTQYTEALRMLLEGFPPPKAVKIRPSASVVPWRYGHSGATEVYWVRRSPALGVLGGWHAFPGGGVSRSDVGIPIARGPNVNPSFRSSFPRFDVTEFEDDLNDALIACVARELMEETGISLLDPCPVDMPRHRQELLAKEKSFVEFLEGAGSRIDAGRLTYAGRWITPPIAPFRFDTRFFLLHWPWNESFQPIVDGQELVEGEWITPESALERWHRHEVLVAPPTLFVLDVLASDGPEHGLRRLVQHGDEPFHPIRRFLETRPGVISLPLVTPTLPPATETTSYLLGRDEVVLVDVGSPFESEIDRLAALLDYLCRGSQKRLSAIWLTHWHPDHLWGVESLRKRLAIPVLAHPTTAERASQFGVRVDGHLQDGQIVELAGDPPLPIRVVATPGHAKGHLCFVDETHGSVICGDIVTGLGTVLIDPPDGDMDEYLQSLEQLRAMSPKTLFPAHGPVITDAAERLETLISHRLEREQRIRESWAQGLRSISQIVREAYTDVSAQLHPFAERQVLAHLIRLKRHGMVEGQWLEQ